MLTEWGRQHPGRIETIFTSLQNIVPSHLLDTVAFDFKNFAEEQATTSPDSDAWLMADKSAD